MEQRPQHPQYRGRRFKYNSHDLETMVASPSELPASQQAIGVASSSQFNFGPDFDPLGQQQRRELILKYAWQHHRFQIIIMGIVMLALFVGVFFWDELCLRGTVAGAYTKTWLRCSKNRKIFHLSKRNRYVL
jgi:hypothetical protein